MIDPTHTLELEESEIDYILDGLRELKKTLKDDHEEVRLINEILGKIRRMTKPDD